MPQSFSKVQNSSKGWLRHFAGNNGAAPLVAGKTIDAFSGATISVDAITTDIGLKTQILQQLTY